MLQHASRALIGPWQLGGEDFLVMAGPCSIETRETYLRAVQDVQKAGAAVLRGGIFKLRTDSRSFQGVGLAGVEILQEARQLTGLPVVSEITDPRQIEELDAAVDMFQVGTRNMHNYELLKELGRSQKPVLLKRGFAALLKEWWMAAEYILAGGNRNVVLCERGIRTFETATRNTLDLAGVAFMKQHYPLPVIVDPSHGTGRRELIEPMALASAAAGADGLMVEVHPDPSVALSDAEQALDLDAFNRLMKRLEKLLPTLDRRLAKPTPSSVKTPLPAEASIV